jgi:hypothetical protein
MASEKSMPQRLPPPARVKGHALAPAAFGREIGTLTLLRRQD